jgi:hypothetical protein
VIAARRRSPELGSLSACEDGRDQSGRYHMRGRGRESRRTCLSKSFEPGKTSSKTSSGKPWKRFPINLRPRAKDRATASAGEEEEEAR